jgi:hypothetical protein
MPTLVCDGVFELVLPEGWSASGRPGHWYDVTPDRGGLELNISVFDRALAQSRAPAELVRQFARTTGLEDVDELPVLAPDDEATERRHFTSFTHDGRRWFVGLLAFPGGVVLASSNCADGDDGAFATGERLVASIAPLRARRRLARYWPRSPR